MRGGSNPKPAPLLPPPPPLPRGPGAHGQGAAGGASPAGLARAPRFPGATCESPPATSSALSCLPSPLAASRLTQRQDPSASPAGTGHPSFTHGGPGAGSPPREMPSPRGPLRSPSPRPDTTASRRRDAAAGLAPPLRPPPPGLVPPDPGSEPRHKPAPALPQLLPKAPSRGRLGPRGAFR